MKTVRRNIPLFTLLLVTAASLIITSCSGVRVYKHAGLLKDIPLNIIVVGQREPDWNRVNSFVNEKVSLFDHRDEQSPLFELNRSGKAKFPPELLATMREALAIARKSGGAFDPTIYALTRAWDFDHGGRLPSRREIEEAKAHVNYKRLILDAGGIATLPEGFGVDLGGIAKGAIVDLLGDYLESLGYDGYLIEAGGDILVRGLKKGARWKIGIKHPRKLNEFVGIVSLGESNKRLAIVTSGDYEQYFEKDGVRYHHILDPSTGYPARGLVSVTIIAGSCTEADALSTAAFVMGYDRGFKMIRDMNGIEGLFVTEKGGNLSAEETEGFPLPLSELKL